MPQTVGCVLYSTPQNAYVVEDQPRCPTRPPLSRSAVLPCPPSLAARLGIPVPYRVSTRDVWVPWRVQIDIHCENRSLIQSLALMRSAMKVNISSHQHSGSHCPALVGPPPLQTAVLGTERMLQLLATFIIVHKTSLWKLAGSLTFKFEKTSLMGFSTDFFKLQVSTHAIFHSDY